MAGYLPEQLDDQLTMQKAIFTCAGLVCRGQQLGAVIMETILKPGSWDLVPCECRQVCWSLDQYLNNSAY